MRTGYFANTKTTTKTHLVDSNNKPICKSNIRNKTFQWCANGVMYSYIECNTCKTKAKQLLEQEVKDRLR